MEYQTFCKTIFIITLVYITLSQLGVCGESHHRSKRAVDPTSNITLQFEKTNGWASKTSVKIADRVYFKITMWIPIASVDMEMEFYTPVDSAGAYMALCPPRITSVGSNLGFSTSSYTPAMISTSNDNLYDYSILDFGNLSNSNVGDSNTDNYKVVIEFEAIVTNHPNLNSSAQYWIGAASSFFNSVKLWVGQASFSFINDATVSGLQPNMSLTGPTSVIPGTTAVWSLTMVLKDAFNNITIDVFAPFNASNTLSICSVSVASTGSGLSCYDKEKGPHIEYYEDDVFTENIIMATIDIGKVFNSAFRNGSSTDADKTMTVNIAAMVLNTTQLTSASLSDLWLGVAAELDQAIIWSAQKPFSISNSSVGMSGNPYMTITATTTSLIPDRHTAIQVNMTLPASTAEIYELEMELPINGTSVLEACDVKIRYVGFNFPCFKQPNVTYISKTNDGVINFVRVSFGVITNTGQKPDNDSNRLVVEVHMRMLRNANVKNGDEFKVTAGVTIGSTKLWVGCTTVIAASAVPPIQAPEFKLVNVMIERNTIYKGGQAAFYLDMKLPIQSYYPKVQFMVAAPYDNSTTPLRLQLYLCRVRIIHVGDNIPCQSEDTAIRMEETIETGYADLATVNLTNVTNVGIFNSGGYNKGNDSTIRFEIVVGVVDDGRMTENATYWTKAAVQYSDTVLWAGQIAVTYSPQVPYLSVENPDPLIEFKMSSNSNIARPGGIVAYDVNMYLSGRTASSYAVDALIPANHTLSVCRIAFQRRGKNVACPNPKVKAKYYVYNQPASQIDRVYFDMGVIMDMGEEVLTKKNREDHLLQVGVVLRLHPDAALVEGANHTFTIGALAGIKTIALTNGVVGVATNKSTLQIATLVTYLTLGSSEAKIVLGGSKTLFVDIYVPRNTLGSYAVEVYAPSNTTHLGKMDVCDLHVTSAGWNLPCVNDSFTNVTYLQDDKNLTYSHAVMELGYVATIGQYGVTEHPDNLLRVEFTVTARSDLGLVVGDKVFVGAAVEVDNSQLWVGQIELTVVGAIMQEKVNWSNDISARMKPPDTPTGAWQRIGDVETWVASVSMPAITASVTINVTMPALSGEALATVVNIHVLGSRNVPCGPKAVLVRTSSTTTSNNQMTFVSATFLVTNTGASRRHQWVGHREDDDLLVGIDIQVADHINNINGSAINFSVGVAVTDNVATGNAVTSSTVRVIRDGTEKPRLQQWLILDPVNASETHPNDSVQLLVHFNHTDNSSAHAFSVTSRLSLPPFMAQPVVTQWTMLQPTTQFINNSFELKYNSVFFVDNVTATLSVKLDPNSQLDIGSGFVRVNMFLETSYWEADRSHWPTPMLDYSTPIDAASFFYSVPECKNVIKIESLAACQVTWQPINRAYSTLATDKWPRDVSFFTDQYLQFSFGNLTRISALQLRLLNTLAVNLELNVTLKSSSVGMRWDLHYINGSTTVKEYYVRINASGSAAGDIKTVQLTEGAVKGRYIRVQWTIINTSVLRRFPSDKVTVDLLGCTLSGDVSNTAVCDASPPVDIYERGVIVNPTQGILYLCMIEDLKNEASCSYTRDLGATWSGIDEEIVNINYLVKPNKLLGLARNRVTRMCSEDGGETWYSIPQYLYDMEIGDISNILGVHTLSFDGSLFGSESPPFTHDDFTLNSTVKFGFNNEGIHVFTSATWTLVGYWDMDNIFV